MYKIAHPLFLLNETPLHAGSGDDNLGIVDLPIQRERHTSFPKIEASSLKGALRQSFEQNDTPISINGTQVAINGTNPNSKKAPIDLTFGPEDAGDQAYAGALALSDARLLLFPVKSMKGVFAWITCPRVLKQLVRDFSLCEGMSTLRAQLPDFADIETNQCLLCSPESRTLSINGKLILEEYTFEIKNSSDKADANTITIGDKSVGAWLLSQGFASDDSYWGQKIKNDIVILSDTDFTDFVNLTTEVITRTKIDNTTGTVQQGGLFTEEYLPAESLMYSIVMASPVFQDKQQSLPLSDAEEVMSYFIQGVQSHKIMQLGANASLGKGMIRMHLPATPTPINSSTHTQPQSNP